MQTFLASLIILLSVLYLLKMWLPVFRGKKAVSASGRDCSQSSASSACNACNGCG